MNRCAARAVSPDGADASRPSLRAKGSHMRVKLLRWAAVTVAASIAVVGLSGVAGSREVIKAVEDPDGGWMWDPDQVHAHKGEKAIWRDTSGVWHTVKFYKGKYKGVVLNLPANERVSKRMRKTGYHRYRCSIPSHSTMKDGECSGMCGVIHVQ